MRSSQLAALPLHGSKPGFCFATTEGDEGDCEIGWLGAWRGRTSLEDCVAHCKATCRQCNFVSWSSATKDCSWYRMCPRQLELQPSGYTTVTVHESIKFGLPHRQAPRHAHLRGRTSLDLECPIQSSGRGIYNASLGPLRGSEHWVLDYLLAKRASDPAFTVIDFGGSFVGWSRPVVDAIVDFNPPKEEPKRAIRYFKVTNFNDHESFAELEAHVAAHGKFSFALSTHTLEDLAYPQLLARRLPRLAKAGFIATPSKFHEFDHPDSLDYRGWIHHRWLFTFVRGVWTFVPKVNYLQARLFDGLGQAGFTYQQLNLFWEGALPFATMNGDFLGPSTAQARHLYQNLLYDDCEAAIKECDVERHSRRRARAARKVGQDM